MNGETRWDHDLGAHSASGVRPAVLADGAVGVAGYVPPTGTDFPPSEFHGGFLQIFEPEGSVRSTKEGGRYRDQEITAVAPTSEGGMALASTNQARSPSDKTVGQPPGTVAQEPDPSVTVWRVDRAGAERWSTQLPNNRGRPDVVEAEDGERVGVVVTGDFYESDTSILEIDNSGAIVKSSDLDQIRFPHRSQWMGEPPGGFARAVCDPGSEHDGSSGIGHIDRYEVGGKAATTSREFDAGVECPLFAAVAPDGSVVVAGNIYHGTNESYEAFLFRMKK